MYFVLLNDGQYMVFPNSEYLVLETFIERHEFFNFFHEVEGPVIYLLKTGIYTDYGGGRM